MRTSQEPPKESCSAAPSGGAEVCLRSHGAKIFQRRTNAPADFKARTEQPQEAQLLMDETPLQALVGETARKSAGRSSALRRNEEARAKLIAAERVISGASIAKLAESYGIGTKGVKNALSLAERAGFYEQIEEAILSRLLPKALAVYEAHLDRGSLDAARDVAFGIGALKKNPTVEVQVGGGIETVDDYRRARKVSEDGSRSVLPAARSRSEG